jgi:hypothetical protein
VKAEQKIMYLDESGDHNLGYVDKDYPLFLLGGVIIDQEHADGELANRMNALKQEFFGRTNIVLHTADIVRNRNGFERLIEPSFRARFYQGMNELMRDIDYKVVACAVRKEAYLAQSELNFVDPYFLCLHALTDRFCFELGHQSPPGLIVAEKRGPALDHELEIAWLNLRIRGTRYMQPKDINRRLAGLNLKAKSDNLPGLQLADLVVTPIGRSLIGRPMREDYRIIRSKFRKGQNGDFRDYGLIVLPKETGPAPATQSPTHTEEPAGTYQHVKQLTRKTFLRCIP